MAMILFALLALTTALSRKELTTDELFQPLFNTTDDSNDTSVERTAIDFGNITEDYDFEEMAVPAEGAGFWEAWELQNRSILEGFTLLDKSPTAIPGSVTEASNWGTESSRPPRIDGLSREYQSPTAASTFPSTSTIGFIDEWISVTTDALEATTYTQEDQVNKPVGDTWPVKLAAEVSCALSFEFLELPNYAHILELALG